VFFYSNHKVVGATWINLNEITPVMPVRLLPTEGKYQFFLSVGWRGTTLGTTGKMPFVIGQQSFDIYLQICQRRAVCPRVDSYVFSRTASMSFFVRQTSKMEMIFASLAKLNVRESDKVARIAKEAPIREFTIALVAKRNPRTPRAESEQCESHDDSC